MEENDLFSIEFLIPRIFKSKVDGVTLKRRAPIIGSVPRQMAS